MTDARPFRETMSRWASHPATAVVALVLSLSLLGWIVSSSFFMSDDFLNFAVASRQGFRQWVNGELFGHWLPARKALDWGLNARPVSWPATVVVMLLFVGLAALLTRLVVLRLTRSGAWANLALVLLPLTAAVPGTVQWYAGAAQVIPAMACSAALILAVVWIPSVRGWQLVGVLVAIAASLGLGLLFDERTAVAAVVAPGLLALLFRGRRLVIAWATAYAVAVPVLAVWYVVQSRLTTSTSGDWADIGTAATFIAKAVVQNAVPALFGWVTRPALWSEESLWGIGALLLALLVVLVLRARSRGRAIWALMVWISAAVLTAAPTAIVRAGQFGVSAALEPRYLLMAMPFGTIALVYVLSLGRPLQRIGRIVAAMTTVILVVSASFSLANLHAFPAGKAPREWAARFVSSAQQQGVTHFYNTVVPGFVNPSAFYPYNLTGAVLPQLMAGVDTIVTEPTAGLVGVDGSVTVVAPTRIGDARLNETEGLEQTGGTGAGCYSAGSAGGRLSFDVPAGIPEEDGVVVVTVVGDFRDSGLRLVTGPSWDALRDKTAGIGASPPVVGSARWVTTEELNDMAVLGIDVPPDQSLCIERVEIGTLPKTD